MYVCVSTCVHILIVCGFPLFIRKCVVLFIFTKKVYFRRSYEVSVTTLTLR